MKLPVKPEQFSSFMVAGFCTGIAIVIWAFATFQTKSEAAEDKEQLKTLHQIHREDIREVKDYLREIRDAIRR